MKGKKEMRALVGAVTLASAAILSGCGSGGPATTESGAIDNLRTVLADYNAAKPNDVASTGAACARAADGLRASSLLQQTPGPGKELAVRQDLHAAYMAALQGFNDCVQGARSMDYLVMSRADSELGGANGWMQAARSARG